MRYVLSIFLFSILLQNIITTNQDILNRMARSAITLRNLVKYKKEQMRKLQANTDEVPEGLNTVPTNIPDEIKNDPEANKTLDPEPVKFPDEVIMPQKPEITPQKNGTSPSIRRGGIKLFHKFDKLEGTKKLNFGMFYYFLDKLIARSIIMRLIIKYASPKKRTLRGLDDETIAGESVRTV